MATVVLIDGTEIENAQLTDIKRVGDEGSRTAIAHVGDKTYIVHNSIIDGFNNIWHEQMSLETWRMTKGAKGFVEGSVSEPPQVCDRCHKVVEALYDVTPAAISDTTTIHVCEECYDAETHELEQDGYDLDLGL